MNDTRIEQSGIGIASVVLSFFPGMLFLVLLLISALLPNPYEARADLTYDGAAVGFFLAFWLLTLLLLNVIALGFGIAGVLQRRRKRLYAILGIACSVLVLGIAYIQDEFYLFF